MNENFLLAMLLKQVSCNNPDLMDY
uniref:Uncharacterized protein n=1 Tax=Nelumbo nucifera TaxID=4432 RepID=A0A822YAC5_NELNU|nr:TPA_asm: hypothetical protein HUJ06_030998 [Nelumbo nucifera]